MAQDPKHAGPTPPQPEQQQEPPGHTAEMTPTPDHGERSYKGSGKLVVDMPAGKGKQGSAAGGSSAASTSKSFAEFDRDNDGALSRMEVAADANAKSSFDRLDKNRDQKLSRDEWAHKQ